MFNRYWLSLGKAARNRIEYFKREWNLYAATTICIAIVALGVITQSAKHNPPNGAGSTEHGQYEPMSPSATTKVSGIAHTGAQNSQNPEEEKFLSLGTEGWIAIFTGVLTLATILLWLETKRLASGAESQGKDFKRSINLMETQSEATKMSAEAASKGADIAEQTMIIAHRAQVIPHPEDIGIHIEKGGLNDTELISVKFIIIWKNFGLTDAINYRHVSNQCILNGSQSEDEITFNPIINGEQAIQPLGPTASAFTESRRFTREELMMAWQTGLYRLYIWSRCEYDDVFKNRGTPSHFREVCIRVDPVKDPRGLVLINNDIVEARSFFRFVAGPNAHNRSS